MMANKRYQVEVWVITSYRLPIEAPDADAAEAQAKGLLAESHIRDLGGVYDDNWQDVMDAEETTP
jgi:hypothetical protein